MTALYAADTSPVAAGLAPRRVGVYIDGFNLYHGMMDKGWGRFRWLDHRQLFERRMRPPEVLVAVKYFTSLLRHEPERLERQQRYLAALKARGGVEVHLGSFEPRKVKCRECGQWAKRHQEKRTDVNIATQLVADGHDRLFEAIYLMSADADLVPAVEHIRCRFQTHVTLVDPPRRHSDELRAVADRHLYLASSTFNQAQLPNPVERAARGGRVRRHYRPPEWGSDSD